METIANAMLRKLGAGVRPDAPAGGRGERPIEHVGFEELVAMARRGVIESGQGLTLADGVGPVGADTMERLSSVADAGRSAGFVRVGALVEEESVEDDGELLVRAYILAVVERRVESAIGESAGRLLSGVDAFVRVPPVDGQALREMLSEHAGRARREHPLAPLLGLGPVQNASLSRVLSGE